MPQVPLVPLLVKVQSIPGGWEVTRPSPPPPRASETLPCAKWNGFQTVMVACRSVLKSPPTVPMIVADCAFVTARVETVKVARADPAGTVTLGGTVAAAVLLLVRSTTKPLVGAAALSVTVPVAASPPAISVGLTVSDASESEDDEGGELTVQPDKRAAVGLVDPSLTSTVQSAGAVKLRCSIRNLPPPSLVPMVTPSTVIVRLGVALPSIRSVVPLSSAREMVTAAWAVEATRSAPIRTNNPPTALLVGLRRGCC